MTGQAWIYCITVTCHCNTVKLVKAHKNEYRFLHTFGFHKNCSALRERETDNYVVMEKNVMKKKKMFVVGKENQTANFICK